MTEGETCQDLVARLDLLPGNVSVRKCWWSWERRLRWLAGGEAGIPRGFCQGCLLFDSLGYFWAEEPAAEVLGSLPYQLAEMLFRDHH